MKARCSCDDHSVANGLACNPGETLFSAAGQYTTHSAANGLACNTGSSLFSTAGHVVIQGRPCLAWRQQSLVWRQKSRSTTTHDGNQDRGHHYSQAAALAASAKRSH